MADQNKSITILVNEKPVKLSDDEATGKQIKQAAIDQGVAIKIDFNLFKVEGNKQHPVGDNEKIEVHENERFRAVAPDDNSWL
jgi:sulfur carrier protein ThiS